MVKFLLALLLAVVVTGCTRAEPVPKYEVSQQHRQQLFKECLSTIPPGPQRTQFNDWDEVIVTCDRISIDQASYCVANCQAFPYVGPRLVQ